MIKKLKSYNDLLKDKKAVFGLNSVQLFFATILVIALLAYVIVVVMGTLLSNNTLIPAGTVSTTIANESGFVNSTGYTLAGASLAGFGNPTISIVINSTSGEVIAAANYSVSSGGIVTNATVFKINNALITYSFTSNGAFRNGANNILANTSTGISGFFANINPAYAILAVMVIILILVVLVRVVSTGAVGGNRSEQSGL